MASLDTLRTSLAQTISNGVTSTIFTYADVEELENFPAAIIEPANADFVEAMNRGLDCWWFNVFVLCSRNDAKVGQSQLDGFVSGAGPDSIRQVIFNNPTLGADSSTDAMVMKMIGYGGTFQNAQIQLVGAILKVRVYTDGRA